MMQSLRPCYFRGMSVLITFGLLIGVLGCAPDESPLKQDNERLRRQVTKQDSMITSLQEGNKVMQQQIDLLNQELRATRQETEQQRADRQAALTRVEAVTAENRKLLAEAGRTAAKKAQVTQSLKVTEAGGQTEELPHPFMAVYKATDEALTQHGYAIRLTVHTDQKAVYVTERKVSPGASLEVSGFRNQYLVTMQGSGPKDTRLSVKADFEKMAQGNRILAASAEETAEIERRLITEIQKVLAAGGKV
jgi:hypothetical protein